MIRLVSNVSERNQLGNFELAQIPCASCYDNDYYNKRSPKLFLRNTTTLSSTIITICILAMNHRCSVFANSCLKLPVDPISKMLKPDYERKDKIVTCQNSVDSSSTSSVYAVKVNTEKIKDFYRSIPDYNDINHLPAEEFYSTLKSLRQKKKVMLEFAVDQIDDSNSENTLVREDAYSNHNGINDKSVETVYNSSLTRKYSTEKKEVSRDNSEATNHNRKFNIKSAQTSKNLTASAMKQPLKKLTVSNLEVTVGEDPKLIPNKTSSMKEKNKSNKPKRNHSACSISWNDDKVETKNEVDQKFQKFFAGAEYSKLKKVHLDDEFKTQSMPSSPLRGKRFGSPQRRRKSITVPKPFKMTER